MQKISYTTYKDKVRGGWVGKCAGGILGAPIEGFKRFNTIALSDSLFDNNFPNDDLDLQILWLDMVLKKGCAIGPMDFSEHWKNHVDFPWNEYGIATRNIAMGLHNPDSGSHNNVYWNQSMGSPIRSEIWGMLCLGQPERAAMYAEMDSTLDHTGFSVDAEKYLSACAAMAFFENDIKKILQKGCDHIPEDGICYHMVQQVMKWADKHSFKTAASKIKSYYGDADFTSAPMNVAFTLLTLLQNDTSFDALIQALQLGHDSDCVVATAGALLGIVVGYDNLPEKWKERVGDELMVSPEITGVHCPKTITELTELTCKAGLYFSEKSRDVQVTESPEKVEIVESSYTLSPKLHIWPNLASKNEGAVEVAYTNNEDEEQVGQLEIRSKYFEAFKSRYSIPPRETKSFILPLRFLDVDFPTEKTSIPYDIMVKQDNVEEKKVQSGIPYYGNWLMLGPFIQDDETLEPQNEKYPDHGLPTQPSARYMNHDKVKPDGADITTEKVLQLLQNHTVFDQDFHTAWVYPDSMKMDLSNYFYGRGERTIYLYTNISSEEDIVKWLCIGSSAYLTIWHNHHEVYSSNKVKRRWPGTHEVELEIVKGKNDLLIKIDNVIDDFLLHIGLKNHNNKHPHQCQWETELQFDAHAKF